MRIKVTIFMSILAQIILVPIAFATDFGVVGQTFKVSEEPFIAMLKKRLDKIDIEKEQEKMLANAKDQVENPIPVSGINPATKNRVFYFDPSYTLDKDAVLPCGKILYKAGTKVNPLEYMDLNRRLFFIDGRRADQVAWLKDQLNSSLTKREQREAKEQKELVEDRVILIGGSVFKLQDEVGQTHIDKVYFDQAGELTTKFGINASPAVVVQDGKYLKVTEIYISEN